MTELKRKRPGSNVYAGLSRSKIKETRRAKRFDVNLSYRERMID